MTPGEDRRGLGGGKRGAPGSHMRLRSVQVSVAQASGPADRGEDGNLGVSSSRKKREKKIYQDRKEHRVDVSRKT